MTESNVSTFPWKYYTHTTETEGICLNLKWTFKNFSKVLHDKSYQFPPIRLTPECDLIVVLFKYHHTVFLRLINKFKSDIRFDVTTVMSGEDGKEVYREANFGWILDERKNFPTGLKSLLLFPETLIIEMKFELYNFKGGICDTASLDAESEMKFADDMKRLILAELPAEVLLRTKDAEFPVNKALLGARSPVFKKMFFHPTTEQENNIVLIADVRGSILKILVDFLLSGKAEIPEEADLQSMKELYYAADKYQVLELRQMCVRIMLSLLEDKNVIELLVFARRHSDKYLNDKCMVFIQTCIDTLVGTEDWAKLKESHFGLAVEVLETCCKGSAVLQHNSE